MADYVFLINYSVSRIALPKNAHSGYYIRLISPTSNKLHQIIGYSTLLNIFIYHPCKLACHLKSTPSSHSVQVLPCKINLTLNNRALSSTFYRATPARSFFWSQCNIFFLKDFELWLLRQDGCYNSRYMPYVFFWSSLASIFESHKFGWHSFPRFKLCPSTSSLISTTVPRQYIFRSNLVPCHAWWCTV